MPQEKTSHDSEDTLAQYQHLLNIRRRGPSRFILIGLATIIALACVGLMLLNPSGVNLPQVGRGPAVTPEARTSILTSSSGQSSTLYLILQGVGDLPDVYRFDPISDTIPYNLTNSRGYSEAWPVVSPDGATLVFFGYGGDGVADLYAMPSTSGPAIPLTKNTGGTQLHDGFEIDLSQPPLWSHAGTWVAFLVRQVDKRGDAVNLYVARSKGSDLQNLTQGGNRVADLTWLGDDEISYVEVRGDGQGTVYRLKIGTPLSTPPASPLPTQAPTPIATLQLTR